MKHGFPGDADIQEVSIAQAMARAYLKAPPELKPILGRRLACEILGLRSSGRWMDQPIDEIDPLVRHIPQDEPVFLLRAEHPMSVSALKTWLSEAEQAGVSEDLLKLVRVQIKEMASWPVKTLPTAPDTPAA